MQHFGIDIGNSGLRVTELLLPEQQLGNTRRINWKHSDAPDEPDSPRRYQPGDPAWLNELQELRGQGSSGNQQTWWISSVRRDASEILAPFLTSSHARCRFVSHEDLPLEKHVDRPERVGIDRLLASLAAASAYVARPLLVIQAGSAVTVDLVTASKSHHGAFEGGAILPGVPMMLRLLGQAADLLPSLDADELTELPDLPGKDTTAAMSLGASSCLVGGVNHLVGRYRKKFGSEVPVILSGGDGMRIASYVDAPLHVEPHLVQQGLLVLADFEQNGKNASRESSA